MARIKYLPLPNTAPVLFLLTVFAIASSVCVTITAHAQSYTLTTLASFAGNDTGERPQSNLVLDKQGNLYGTTSAGNVGNGGKYGTVFKIDSVTHALTTIATFDGANGAAPCGTLAIDKNGSLYGTTLSGGTDAKTEHRTNGFGGLSLSTPRFANFGTVFKVAKIDVSKGIITTLASFDGDLVTGCFPEGLALDANGNLYGTTPFTQMGPGTLFEIAADTNAFTSFAVFDYKAADPGGSPSGRNKSINTNAAPRVSLEGMVCPGVAIDRMGNLYGTVRSSNSHPDGFVYQINAATKRWVALATFTRPNGQRPNGYITLDGKGNLYGTTEAGGEYDKGTVFKVESGTHRLVTLASFDGKNGSSPETGVIIDRAGNLYGTTADSIAVSGTEPLRIPSIRLGEKSGSRRSGTVFRIAAGTKAITTLARFDSILSAFPTAGLTMDGKGNIYGAANEGDLNGSGIVFKLTRIQALSKK